jgi:very-short-patch-repair endonuclease
MTDAAKKLWWHLRQLPVDGTHFRRQSPIGPFYADFACRKLRVVIEIDGSQHARTDSMAADEKRTA